MAARESTELAWMALSAPRQLGTRIRVSEWRPIAVRLVVGYALLLALLVPITAFLARSHSPARSLLLSGGLAIDLLRIALFGAIVHWTLRMFSGVTEPLVKTLTCVLYVSLALALPSILAGLIVLLVDPRAEALFFMGVLAVGGLVSLGLTTTALKTLHRVSWPSILGAVFSGCFVGGIGLAALQYYGPSDQVVGLVSPTLGESLEITQCVRPRDRTFESEVRAALPIDMESAEVTPSGIVRYKRSVPALPRESQLSWGRAVTCLEGLSPRRRRSRELLDLALMCARGRVTLAEAVIEAPEPATADEVTRLQDEAIASLRTCVRFWRRSHDVVDEVAAQEPEPEPGTDPDGAGLLLAHMLARTDGGRSPEAAHRLVLLWRARVVAGESFATVAREVSEDEATRFRGGALGVVDGDSLMPDLRHVALALEPGETSYPVASRHGYHLLHMNAIRRVGNDPP